MQQIPTKIQNYLIADFESRQRANPRYSLRAYAKHLEIASSLLSRLLKGRVPVTQRMLVRLNQKLAMPAETLNECAREIQASEAARKETQRHRTLNRKKQATRSKTDTSTFTIQCQAGLVPIVLSEIQSFQKALAELVTQNDGEAADDCELRISIQYTTRA